MAATPQVMAALVKALASSKERSGGGKYLGFYLGHLNAVS